MAPVLLAIAPLIWSAGCGARHAPGSAHRLRSAPPLADAEIGLYAELLAAADARRTDTVLLARGLKSRGSAVRVEAARVAGQVHASVFAAALRAAVTDHDTAVAANATYSLGLLRDTGAVPVLAAALRAAPGVAAEAAWSLGEIGQSARPAIESALGDTTRPPAPPALVGLLLAAGKLRPVPVAVIARFLRPGDAGTTAPITWAAATALSRPPTIDGARALLGVVGSPDPDTRSSAARGLARPPDIGRGAGERAGPVSDSLVAQARPALVVLAGDSDAHVRVEAVRALATYGAASRPGVVAALHDPDANVRIAAGQVLDLVLASGVTGAGGGAGRPATMGVWNAAFDADTTLAYRRGVVAAAVRSGVVLEVIDHDNPDRWQRQGKWRYRAATAEAATGTSIARIVDLSLPLTRDPDGRVRAAAYGTLVPWLDSADAPAHPWRRTYVRGGLHDVDCIVRSTVLSALAGSATAADLGDALDGYVRARDDSQSDARVAAVQLMAAVWARDSGHVSDSLKEAMRELPLPTSLLELDQAGRGSVWTRWVAAREGWAPPHARVWYDSVVRAVVVPTLAGRPLTARIVTARGPLTIALFGADASLTVANFAALARAGYYRGTGFHRVVPAFVAQDGDRRGDGSGSPPYSIRDELNRRRYGRGAVGMALSGPDTGGSQYFVTLTPQPHLDGRYTVFGTVTDGYSALDRLVQGDSIVSIDVP